MLALTGALCVLPAYAHYMQATHEVEIEAPLLQSTRSGRMIRPPRGWLPELRAASPNESNSNRKMDLVLAVKVGCSCTQPVLNDIARTCKVS